MAELHRLILFVVLLSVLSLALARKDRKVRSGQPKPPRAQKLRLKVVAARLIELENTVKDLTEKVKRVDSAQGVFSDEPPCPIQSAVGFNGSKALGSCYRMEATTNMMNWTEAQAFCKSLHRKSHLVAIETEAEQKFLKAKWLNECGISSLARFWTDGSKSNEDDWFWATGHSRVLLKYQNWISTTTHDDERFNCIAVYASEAYAWGDVACWAPHVVTCEIEL